MSLDGNDETRRRNEYHIRKQEGRFTIVNINTRHKNHIRFGYEIYHLCMSIKQNRSKCVVLWILIFVVLLLQTNNSIYTISNTVTGKNVITTENMIDSKDISICSDMINSTRFITQLERSEYLQHHFPPYFISFAGSGNTISRLIIEYITGFYTGSIYDSFILRDYHNYKGEMICDSRVIVVKIHPEAIYLIPPLHRYPQRKGWLLLNGTFPCTGSERLRKIPKSPQYLLKNLHQFAQNQVASAIYLIRNPWKAVFSEYNLIRGWNDGKNHSFVSPHTAKVYKKHFDVEQFKKHIAAKMQYWSWTFRFIDIHKMLCKQNNGNCFIIVYFEKIFNKNMDIRSNEILKMIKFLINDDKFNENYDVYLKQSQCVLEIEHCTNDTRMRSIHRHRQSKHSEPSVIGFDEAFGLSGNSFICSLWNLIKQDAMQHGYTIWNDTICEQ